MLIAAICFVGALGVGFSFLWLGPIDQAAL
jgi:hypothetical protein